MHAWYADYLEACNRHDLDAIRSFVDPHVRRAHLPGGVEAWMSDLVEVLDAFPDWQVRRIQLVVEDDRIAAHVRASGTHTGPFRGTRATRRHVNVAEFGFLRLAQGRIVEFAGTTDHAALLAQLRD